MGGGGRPPAGGSLGRPLGQGVLNLPAIIAAAAAANAAVVTQGYAAAAAASPSVSNSASAPLARVLSLLKLLHLRFICGVAMDADIPRIWVEVCWAPTKAAALAVLSQYLWSGREVFWRELFGSANMLHVCGALFMFVHGDRFVNTWHDPVCPAGGVSFWITRQGGGNVGENIAPTEGTIMSLDGANVGHKEVTTMIWTKLTVVVVPLTTATEMGTHTYVLNSLLERASLVVEAILPLVDWIYQKRTECVRLMAEQDTTTWFVYDVLWIVLAYLNNCIFSLTAAVEGDPGAHTPVSFQYLIDELSHGRYTGRALPRYLQDLLNVRAGRRAALVSAAALTMPATQTIVGDG